MHIYITGDTHGGTVGIAEFCEKRKTTKEDILIILGDACLNYDGWAYDHLRKERLERCPITIFLIHGNHEMRPETIPTYQLKDWRGGQVWVEEEYPSLLFAKDGEIFDLEGVKTFVCGGAYSVDKKIRYFQWLRGERSGWEWWPDEQPSEETKKYCEKQLEKENWQVDVFLSHTCPKKYMPREAFLELPEPEAVDNSTEEWLDQIEDRLEYQKWFCGHFHIDKAIDNMQFVFDDFVKLV